MVYSIHEEFQKSKVIFSNKFLKIEYNINHIFPSAQNAMQLLITVCSRARHEVTIDRCSPGIEITSQFLPVPMSMQMSSMLDTTITCHIVRWLRNCCVTPAPSKKL